MSPLFGWKKKQSPVSGNFFNKNFASSIWFLLFRPDATIWNLFRVLFFAWWHHLNYFPHWNFWWRINFIAVFLQWELIRQIWIQKEIFDFFSSNVFWKKQQIPSKIKFIICTGNLFALSFSFMLRKRLCFFFKIFPIFCYSVFSLHVVLIKWIDVCHNSKFECVSVHGFRFWKESQEHWIPHPYKGLKWSTTSNVGKIVQIMILRKKKTQRQKWKKSMLLNHHKLPGKSGFSI